MEIISIFKKKWNQNAIFKQGDKALKKNIIKENILRSKDKNVQQPSPTNPPSFSPVQSMVKTIFIWLRSLR